MIVRDPGEALGVREHRWWFAPASMMRSWGNDDSRRLVMNTRALRSLLAFGTICLWASGCASPGAEDVKSLDVATWESGEGSFAVRVFTRLQMRTSSTKHKWIQT